MTERHKTKRKIKFAIIGLLLLFLIGYTGFEIQKLVFGPKISISFPKNGILVSDSLIEITGVAANVKQITLNDRPINIDENGNFKEKILLSYGYNSLTMHASDKFGQETEKSLELIYK